MSPPQREAGPLTTDPISKSTDNGNLNHRDGLAACIRCGAMTDRRTPTGHAACLDCWEDPRGPRGLDQILLEVSSWLGRFVAYPSEDALIAHALWIAHTHAMDCWASTPRLSFLSQEPASGKTRALEVTEPLVPNPVCAVNVTPSYLFRKVGGAGTNLPTILYDEIDTVFGPRARENEEIRGLLNAGHRRGAIAGRCVVAGNIVKTEEIPAFSAVLLAGLGDLPATIIDRSIVIRMRRRAPGEVVEPYRQTVHGSQGEQLRDRLAAAIDGLSGGLADARPTMPAGVDDRDADKWESLLAIADAAGGDWPRRARVSAVSLVSLSKGSTPSLGIRLLEDIRTVFGDREVMTTEQILEALLGLEESPWGDLYGKPLNARGLAQRLQKYDVAKSHTVRIGELLAKGYAKADLWDAWNRYLQPSVLPHSPPQGEKDTSDTNGSDAESEAMALLAEELGAADATDEELVGFGGRR